jgi:hypothetical protein
MLQLYLWQQKILGAHLGVSFSVHQNVQDSLGGLPTFPFIGHCISDLVSNEPKVKFMHSSNQTEHYRKQQH